VPEGSLPGPRLDLQGSLADATRRAVAGVERYKIAEALREAGGDKARAAEILQINFKTLLVKLKESGLDS
jgi:DNA-binding NtrC family response regulator